ncbi:hypothetical protein GGS21DRAFT_334634 [Xylaria nigripes]|nr:hypothetical protein GGS21DRAFT_334634 [Xylaria nigripes]
MVSGAVAKQSTYVTCSVDFPFCLLTRVSLSVVFSIVPGIGALESTRCLISHITRLPILEPVMQANARGLGTFASYTQNNDLFQAASVQLMPLKNRHVRSSKPPPCPLPSARMDMLADHAHRLDSSGSLRSARFRFPCSYCTVAVDGRMMKLAQHFPPSHTVPRMIRAVQGFDLPKEFRHAVRLQVARHDTIDEKDLDVY